MFTASKNLANLLSVFAIFWAPSTLAQTSEADLAPKAAITDYLGEGDIVHFVDGTKLVGTDFYTVFVEGDGPDVLLIPGLATPPEVWNKTREQLKNRYRVHTVQVRGFGNRAPVDDDLPPDKTHFDGVVFELADYIDDYVVDELEGSPPIIIGHSMGGLMAMAIAARGPNLVDKVMVVDSLPYIGLLFGRTASVKSLLPQTLTMRDAMAARDTAEPDQRTLQTMSATEKGRAQVAAWGKSSDPKVVAQYFYDVMTTDIRPELANIRAPLTVLYPWDSTVMPETMADGLYKGAYADVTRASLKRIENSRHFIMLDQPEAFAAAVEEFLKD